MGPVSLHRLPRSLPPITDILADLGNPPPAALARALGVSERSVWRWRAAPERTPRPVVLALFFASRWGWSAVDADARTAVRLAQALTVSLRAEIEQLAGEVQRLEALGGYGSANSPANPRLVVVARTTPGRVGPGLGNPAAKPGNLADDQGGQHGAGQHDSGLHKDRA